MQQTYRNVEIIVVDDGSTDGSLQLLRRYEGRAMVTSQANRGASSARNQALRHATGALVAFLDADDQIGPTHLEELASKVNDKTTIAVGPWARFCDHITDARLSERYITEDIAGVDWLTTTWGAGLPMMQPGMFLLPRALIDRVGGWNEDLSLIDDFEFFARVIAASRVVRYASGARLYYRSGLSGSLSGQKSRKAIESQFLSLMLGTGHLLAAEDSPRTRRACANVLQAFDYEHYPKHADLRARIRARVSELGGADIAPSGPPGFHKLRPWIGWRAARHVQRAAERLGMNGAARKRAAGSAGA